MANNGRGAAVPNSGFGCSQQASIMPIPDFHIRTDKENKDLRCKKRPGDAKTGGVDPIHGGGAADAAAERRYCELLFHEPPRRTR